MCIVSRKSMLLPRSTVLFALALILVGCATSRHSPDGMLGTWSFSLGESRMLVRLDGNGQWAWRSPDEGANSEAPTQSGRWFVHDGILVLRIEKSASDKLPEGIAFTYDLRRVLPDRLIMFDRGMKREMIWTRDANQRVERMGASLLGRSQSSRHWRLGVSRLLSA